MQKLVFKNSTELQIDSIIAQNRFLNGQNSEFYQVTFQPNGLTFEQVKAIFHDSSNLSEFDIFTLTEIETEAGTVPEWIYQGTSIDYSILKKISYNIEINVYEVEIAKQNELEVKLAQNEAGILELAELISSLMV